MKITKIILRKHKFLTLRNIKELVFEPNSLFQWILGTNGSGKSTLLREYSPLAAVPSHYYKGGAKIVEGTDKNLRYVLTCDFSGPKNIFSFVEISPEGVETELNPGHTGTVYNNLVWQKFRIDKEVQEIRTGRKKFTELKPEDRKAWISRISDADYSYALGYFKKLITHYRDVLGSIKTDQNRLLEATTKAITKEEERQHRELLKHLREEIDHLNEIRPNPSVGLKVVLEDTLRLKESLVRQEKDFRNSLRSNRALFPLGNAENNEVDLRGYEIEYSKINDQIQILFERSKEITSLLGNRGKTVSLDSDILQEKITTLAQEVEDIYFNMKFPLGLLLDKHKLSEAVFAFDHWNTSLGNIVAEMLPDPNNLYTSDFQNEVFESYQELTTKTNILEVKIHNLEEEIKKQVECSKEDHLTCPSCNHKWHPNFNRLVLEDLQEKRSKGLVLLEEFKAKKEKVYEDLCRSRKYHTGLQMFFGLEESSPLFKAFYATAKNEDIHKKSPDQLLQLAIQFRHELNFYSTVIEKEETLQELRTESLRRSNEEVETIKKLETELHNNSGVVSKLYDESEELFKRISYLKRKIQFRKEIEKNKEFAERSKENIEKLMATYAEHDSRSFIGDMILERNHKLISLEKSLREVDMHNHHVAMLERQIEETKEYARALKIAVDELSPREGLIAYGLTGFINHFLKIVNALIAKFWSYPFELLPFVPDEEGIDLDYKFRIKIGEEVSDDISFCSEGQKEIVNLAIMITSLVLMHLDDDCLILDEFGVKLDYAHRMTSYKAIEELLSNSNFSRILMVSHFDESFNTNIEADVSVICDANLDLPVNLYYNKHMTIT